MVEIIPVRTAAQRREFVNFPVRLYQGNPYFVPDMRSDALEFIHPKKNISWKTWPAACFLAKKDGKTAGRIMAIWQKDSNRIRNETSIRFSRIDFIDDMEVSGALLKTVEDWAREREMTRVHGPLGFLDTDPEGMLIDGFDELDMFITIYNAPYYQDHMEAHGYAKDVDWIEYQITVPDKDSESVVKMERLSKVLEKRGGYRVRHLKNAKDIREIAEPFMRLVSEAYKDLYGYVQLDDEQIGVIVRKFFPLLNPAFLKMVYSAEGELIAGGVGIPSLAKAMQKHAGRLFPVGWIRVLHDLKVNDRLELLLIAVKAEYQNKGVPALLISAMAKEVIDKGYKTAETGPELEENEKIHALWKSFDRRLHRRRRVFTKNI